MFCKMCKRPLDIPGDPASLDCGGDCAGCMAASNDPDCERRLLEAAAAPHATVEVTDDFLRQWWRKAGGHFHGPNIETGTMPESQLLPLLRNLMQPRGDVRQITLTDRLSHAVDGIEQVLADRKEGGKPRFSLEEVEALVRPVLDIGRSA